MSRKSSEPGINGLGETSNSSAPLADSDKQSNRASSNSSEASAGVVVPPKLLNHLAIIMDGNNRWAKKRHMPGMAGHRAGVEVIRKVLSACERHGIKVLTLFAFSSENWQRPDEEVGALMSLLLNYLKREVAALHKRGVCLRFIGKRDRLNQEILKHMELAEQLTADNKISTMILAIDYGGHWDISQATRQIAEQVQSGELTPAEIDERLLNQYTCMADLPKPDLCIRTGGEFRISNFLLWQLAYAELYFTDCFWPDFDEQHVDEAVSEYATRQRRYGMTGEQLVIAQGGDPC